MYITAQGCRLRNDLYCVEWDIKLYYTIPSLDTHYHPLAGTKLYCLMTRGTRVLTTCPGFHSTAGQLEFEPATYWSQVRHPTATAPSHTAKAIHAVKVSTFAIYDDTEPHYYWKPMFAKHVYRHITAGQTVHSSHQGMQPVSLTSKLSYIKLSYCQDRQTGILHQQYLWNFSH